MHHRFKEGDRVVVVDNICCEDAEAIGVNDLMIAMVGGTYTIRKCSYWMGFVGYRLREDRDDWLFPESMLESANTVSFLDIIQEGEANG